MCPLHVTVLWFLSRQVRQVCCQGQTISASYTGQVVVSTNATGLARVCANAIIL